MQAGIERRPLGHEVLGPWAVILALASPYQGVKFGPGPDLGIQSESRVLVMMDPPWP